jgi:hypothetical protein
MKAHATAAIIPGHWLMLATGIGQTANAEACVINLGETMSHVALEQAVCPVCGQKHDTGTILLDRQLREDTFKEMGVATHFDMCPEHKELWEKGFVALVGIDPDQSENNGGKIKPENAYRTGTVMHINKDLLNHMVNVAVEGPVVFVEDEVIDMFKKMYKEHTGLDLDEEENNGVEDKRVSGEGARNGRADTENAS